MHDDDTPFRTPEPTLDRPTLLSSCAKATTAEETRFRVQYPNAAPRSSRIVAMDDGAARIMADIMGEPRPAAHFLRVAPRQPDISPYEVVLLRADGAEVLCSAELVGADVVVMIATSAQGQRAAEIVGRLARGASVMTAGLVVTGDAADDVVRVMRPATGVLVVSPDADHLAAMLSALRA
jgi:hypothetical protein